MPTNSNYGAEKSSGALPRSGCRGATQGKDIQDACESAADHLRILIEDYYLRGKEPPKSSFGNKLKEGRFGQ